MNEIVVMADNPIQNFNVPNLMCSHHICEKKATWFLTIKMFGVDYLLPVCEEHRTELARHWP